MKTEDRGGDSADSNLKDRLAQHFAGRLDQAERDYPASGAADRLRQGSAAAPSRWSRLAAPVAGLAVLAAVALIAAGLALGPMAAPGPAGSGKRVGSIEPSSACGAGNVNAAGASAACSIVPLASLPNVVPGQDGIPASIGGQTVYRYGTLPAMKLGSSILLGGVVGRDTSCAAPSPWTVMYAPSCGYWTVDGIKLGAVPGVLDQAMIGKSVVVQVTMSRVITQCFAPCPPTPFLYVAKVVWENGVALP